MIAHSRFRFTSWIAFADFFAALALFAFALYGVQRQKEIRIEQPVHSFAHQLYVELLKQKMQNVEFDESRSSLSLKEAVLFERNKWTINDSDAVRKLANALKAVESSLRASDPLSWNQTKSFHLVIRGHADARPMGRLSNTWLSQQRARALEDALLQQGIAAPGFQISSQGVGESEPIVDNCLPQSDRPRIACPEGQYAADAALAPNRRIELRFGFFSGF